MQLTFLQAAVPLTKKYTKRPSGGYDSTSYPLVSKVTSHLEEISNVDELAAAINKHAASGHCLHTGSLDKQLVDESRKGHHLKDEEREWITLDLDGIQYQDVETFIQELPATFRDVSYVVQHSPSSGIKPGLRAHVFFLLDRPENMDTVSDWIKYTNLVTDSLRNQVTLAPSQKILSFPLDWIANKNGRVVYIAAPECIGFSDPVPDRVQVVSKAYPRLRHTFTKTTPGDIKDAVRKTIDDLRATAGLSKLRAGELYEAGKDGQEILRKSLTDAGRIHDCVPDSNTHMRCNIDGGDSHAYFYLIEHPRLIRNHKGEPQIFMEAFAPDYYNNVAMPAARKMLEKKKQPFVFRNEHDDKWYVGLRLGEELITQPHSIGSEKKIQDYFDQHGGLGVPANIPSWRMEFEPTRDKQWNPDELLLNTWRRTDIMKDATYRTLPPRVITKIIGHVVGGDGEAYDRFINWLACIYQSRIKTGTAWIFHGVQGTGKGLLVDHIIRPIFGKDYVAKQQTKGLKDAFNIWMEKAIIVNLDEFDVSDTGGEANMIMQNLKTWITDDYIAVRGMHAASRPARNYSNFILTTNARAALPIDEGDRRISFGKRQESKLVISSEEVNAIKDELVDFAGYLLGYEVDEDMVHICLENEAKDIARSLGKTSIQEFVDAVHDGDLQFFIDGMSEHSGDLSLPHDYQKLVDSWMIDAKAEAGESFISTTQLLLAYRMLCNEDKKLKTGKFSKMMSYKAFQPTYMRTPTGRVNGWRIKWNMDQETLVKIRGHMKPVKSSADMEKEIQKEIASPEGQ